MNYLLIAASSAAVYLFIVIAFRIFGKKELAQLSVLDLVFILLISNSVQNAMVGPDTSLSGGLVAALTLFVLNHFFKYLLYRSPSLTRFFEGGPVILVFNGKVNDANMRQVQISTDELLEAIREHGVADIKEVNLATLEVDGNISILSGNYEKKSLKMMVRKKKHGAKNSSVV